MKQSDIEVLAIAKGFKKKQQPDGTDALNPYVFDFARELIEKAKPEVFIGEISEGTGIMYLSAYSIDDPLWETNHIAIGEISNGKINKHHSAQNILRNVLSLAGIRVIMET